MLKRLRSKLLRRLQLRESWIIFFIMGVILLNFPFLHIFNKPDTLFGIPLMVLYLYLGWAASIIIIYLFTVAIGNSDVPPPEKYQP